MVRFLALLWLCLHRSAAFEFDADLTLRRQRHFHPDVKMAMTIGTTHPILDVIGTGTELLFF